MDMKPITSVTLPLSPADMVEFFKDKDQHYEVNVAETLKGMAERPMLLYLSNLGIKCSFSEVSSTLMEEYMVLKDFVEAPMLATIHANILYFLKYQEVAYPIALNDFSIDDMIAFIDGHQDLVIEQAIFLDSFLLYIETRKNEELQKDHPHVDNELHDELGFSVVTLLNHEDFMIPFSKTIPPLEHQTYYSRYFDDYMFKGKNLFYYANTSPLFGMVVLMGNEKAG